MKIWRSRLQVKNDSIYIENETNFHNLVLVLYLTKNYFQKWTAMNLKMSIKKITD